MKKLLLALSVVLLSTTTKAQCLYIESILVDACNSAPCPGTATEGENEMVLFKVGATPLTIAYGTTAAAMLTPTWPNNSFLGWQAPGAITNPLVSALNSTIVKCGYLKQPVAGVLPANSQVLIITSTNMCTAGNSFANLTDTLYVIFQVAGNTAGHFANNDNSATVSSTPTGTVSPRTMKLAYTGVPACTESVIYDRSLLVNDLGTYGGSATQNDGSTVQYNAAGTATYVNNGCQAPYIPMTVTASAPASTCSNANPVLTGVISGPAVTYSWTSNGTGTVSVPTGTLSGAGSTTVSPTYTPSAGESGTVTFTLTAAGKCSLAVETSTVSIFINPAPTPTISSSGGATLCSGNSTVLSSSSSGTLTTTWAWSPGGATTSTISVSPPTGTNIYTVTATNSCGSVSAHYTVNVTATPTMSISGNHPLCIGGSEILTGGTATNYTWMPGNITTNTISVNPASTTTYTLTGSNGTCTASTTAQVVVNANPTITVNNPTTCSGQAVTLQANPTTLASYTWTGVSSSSSTASVAPNSTSSYTVSATDANGCMSNAAISTVTVTASTQISVTSSSNLPCINSTYTLTANGATTYSWVASAGTFTSLDANNTQISATQSTAAVTYTVSGTGACPATATVVTITPAPVTTLTITAQPNNATICSGGTVTLTAAGANTYTWNPTITNGVAFTPSSTQVYSVTGTDANNCLSATDTISVIVNTPPVLTVASQTICPSSTATLTAMPTTLTSYTWSTGSSADTTIVHPSVNSIYNVSATDANGCVGTATASVNIVNSLTVTALATNSLSCSGSLDTLIASGAQSYTWTSSSGSTTSISTNNDTVTIVPTTSTTYTVKGSSGACSDSATVTINIAPSINVTITSNPVNATICLGDSITLNGSGANTYTWTGGITNGAPFSPTTSQTYTVTGTNAQGCTGTASQSVTVNSLPSVNINASSAAICAGQSDTLTASGANTYTWSTTQTTASITIAPNTTQSYTVVGTDGNSCTNANAPTVITVTVNPLPTVTIASNPANSTVCAGSLATLTASGAQTYTWNSGSNANPLSVSPSAQTTYTVVGLDANNCMNIATITINVNPLPIAQSVTGNTFVCIGAINAPTILSAANPGTWTGPAPLTTTISANSTTATITQGGVYTLNTINSCGNATTTYTVVADSVKAGFTASPLTGQVPLTVTYANASQGNSLNYVWIFGDGNNSIASNPTNIFNAAGNYQTLLTATDNLGCKDTATIDIVVHSVPSIIVIPNVFTPNNDGINDVFSVNATGITNFDCKVYDRWGLLLHEWTGTDGGWDGKAKNGSNCTDGTYYYLITYTDNLNKSIIKDGFFQLIR